MYISHLLEFDFALTTGKHTQMAKETRRGKKVLVLQTEVTFQEALTVHTHYKSIHRSHCRSHVPKPLQCL